MDQQTPVGLVLRAGALLGQRPARIGRCAPAETGTTMALATGLYHMNPETVALARPAPAPGLGPHLDLGAIA